MKNIENKKYSVQLILFSTLGLIIGTLLKEPYYTEEYAGELNGKTYFEFLYLEFDYIHTVIFLLIILAIGIYTFLFHNNSDFKILNTILTWFLNKSKELLEYVKDKKNRIMVIILIILIFILVLILKAIGYYIHLLELKEGNPYIVFTGWQASFLGFMNVAKIALPISIVLGLLNIYKKQK